MATLRPVASNSAPPMAEDIDVDSPEAEGEADGEAEAEGEEGAEAEDAMEMQERNQHENQGRGAANELKGHTLDDLRNPPKDLDAMRQRLFEMKDKIELRVDEFERYWPYIDNVWVRQHKAGTDKSGRVVTDYYACRLQRPTYAPKTDSPRREGQPKRKKQIREGGTCQMRLKTIRYNGGYTGYTILRIGDDDHHTHTLDYLDQIKRTSVMMEIARNEVMKGYMPASVFTVMNEDPEKLVAAGGRHLNRNDVRNASQQWRSENREDLHLQVHPGYKYDHGNGIVRQNNVDDALNNFVNMVDPALTGLNNMPPNAVHFPEVYRGFLESYIPASNIELTPDGLPHVTLTYATSMDSCVSIAPGLQTALSSPQTKAMTHYLRSKHDAILVGVGTAIADNPSLNCRLQGVGGYGGVGWDRQPRPVVIDPSARWLITPQTRILQAVEKCQGRAPWVIMAPGSQIDPYRLELLKYFGGKYLGLTEFDKKWRLRWEAILRALAAEGIRSVMIEGGAMVINELLQPEHANLITSVVVTVAPTYLGRGGVTVSPIARRDGEGRPQPTLPRFRNCRWQSVGGDDAVFCGRMPLFEGQPAPQHQGQAPPSQNHGPAPTAQM